MYFDFSGRDAIIRCGMIHSVLWRLEMSASCVFYPGRMNTLSAMSTMGSCWRLCGMMMMVVVVVVVVLAHLMDVHFGVWVNLLSLAGCVR